MTKQEAQLQNDSMRDLINKEQEYICVHSYGNFKSGQIWTLLDVTMINEKTDGWNNMASLRLKENPSGIGNIYLFLLKSNFSPVP